jgi:multicomponent Na+:H+ antiporter subunit G
MNIIGNIFLLIGAIFLFLGALGLIRMPDIYTRIQAATKTTTLGSISILLGVAIHHPLWITQLLLIAGFILLSSPVAASMIARAAYMTSLKPFTEHEHHQPEQEKT